MDGISALQVHVRRCLDRFCQGKYFMEHDLPETAKLIPDDVDVDNPESMEELTNKKSNFYKFLKIVATEMVKEEKEEDNIEGKGRKKRIKEKLEILQAFTAEWVQFIERNMRKKAKMNSNNLMMTGSGSGNFSPDGGKASADDGGGDGGTPEKKKSAKRGPWGPYKKRKMKSTPEPVIASPKKRQKMDTAAARKEFEKEVAAVMAQVPKRNQELFQQVGFGKWGKGFLPAMVVSPYSVPPGDIRDQWMKMYQNVVEKNRINSMGHLVWWITPEEDEEESSYSVVPANGGFMTYEEGKKKGYHELPKPMKRLLEKGKPFNSKQEEIAKQISLLNELALMEPDDREHPRGDFSEEDFWGLGDDEIEENVDEDLLDDEEVLQAANDGDDFPLKKKKKKGKKRKQGKLDDGDEEAEFDRDEKLVIEKKKDKDKTKKKKKKLAEALESEEMELEDTDDMPRREIILEDDDDEELDDRKPVPRRKSIDEDPLLDEESVASGDSALDDSDFDADRDDDGDEQLRNVDPENLPTKKVKKYKAEKSNDESLDVADEPPKKPKPKKDIAPTKAKVPKDSKKRSKAREQRDLEKCEDQYLPMIEELKIVRQNKINGKIQKVLNDLLPVADDFTASFFSEYEIPKIMKATKSVLEEIGGDTSVYRRLWNKMKASYTVKAPLVPDDFKAKKRRSLKPSKDESKRVLEEEEQGVTKTAASVKEETTPLQSTAVPSESAQLTDPAKRRTSADSESMSKTTDKIKQKQKKFSIMDIMAKKKDSRRTSIGSNSDKMTPSSSAQNLTRKTVPSWVTTPPTTFDSFEGSEHREDRLFALEFLLQAAAHFPSDKDVNEEAIARSLEAAIYEWAKQKGNFAETYWDKVHSIVAALAGKREIGSLVNFIMEGSFPSANAVVNLSFDNLANSFEGRPLVLGGE